MKFLNGVNGRGVQSGQYAGTVYIEQRQPVIVLNVTELSLIVEQKEVDRIATLCGYGPNLLHKYGKQIGLTLTP